MLKRSKLNGLLVNQMPNNQDCRVICENGKEVIATYVIGLAVDPLDIAEGLTVVPQVQYLMSDGTTKPADPADLTITVSPEWKATVNPDGSITGMEPGDASVTFTFNGVTPPVSTTQEIVITPPVIVGLRFNPETLSIPVGVPGITAVEKQMSTGEWVLVNADELALSVTSGNASLTATGGTTIELQGLNEGPVQAIATLDGFTATLQAHVATP